METMEDSQFHVAPEEDVGNTALPSLDEAHRVRAYPLAHSSGVKTAFGQFQNRGKPPI